MAGPTSEDVQKARNLRQESKSLKVEAEALWDLVQATSEQGDVKETQPRVERLKEIQAEIKGKADGFVRLLEKSPELATLFVDEGAQSPAKSQKPVSAANKRKSMFSSCCFADIADGDQDINKRASLSCPDRVSKVEMIATESELFGEVECIVLEPRAKSLAPDQYVTTGVVVCMQGIMPPSKDTIKEWGLTNDLAGWTNSGATVVIPNVQANSALEASDIADILNGICDFVGFDRVLLVGKDLAAETLLRLGVDPTFDRSIAGIILLGPTTPPPRLSSELPVPFFLLWAQDDEVSPFEDHVQWIDMAREGYLPVMTAKWCSKGGHDFGQVGGQEGVPEQMKNFFISSLLASDLMESDEAVDEQETKAGARIEQLTRQLPAEMQRSLQSAAQGEDGSVGKSLSRNQRMSIKVGDWINSGMHEKDTATE
mmetsp:Transcript_46715/g.99943  ORF Transcript_46715/g.99943 Transcript_46715/m.99943 type:complete len:428 (-) Transcript_46715:247-1530(-)